ncbi:hypothetical protein ACFSUS_21405 [Spirosoma soli]|uniref:Uncharacterized protein n=1 Tax=Spirosoma soli TaxID=1770529 RepID=A0ABW5M9R7_9BACT
MKLTINKKSIARLAPSQLATLVAGAVDTQVGTVRVVGESCATSCIQVTR